MTMYQVILLLTLTHSSHRSPGKKRCEVVPGGYTGEMIDELMYFAQPDSGLRASSASLVAPLLDPLSSLK